MPSNWCSLCTKYVRASSIRETIQRITSFFETNQDLCTYQMSFQFLFLENANFFIRATCQMQRFDYRLYLEGGCNRARQTKNFKRSFTLNILYRLRARVRNPEVRKSSIIIVCNKVKQHKQHYYK